MSLNIIAALLNVIVFNISMWIVDDWKFAMRNKCGTINRGVA